MSTTDPAVNNEAEGAPETVSDATVAGEGTQEQHMPVMTEREQQVTLVRSVRYGRVVVGTAILGAALLSLASLFFPVGPESEYSMAQVVGFMALIGGALGLGLGAIIAVIMTAAAKRKRGIAVAIQTDVQ